MRRAVERQRDAGLTLVELLITLVVAALVASSTFVFFAGQQRIYETQTKLLNIHQNVTAAMELLVRYARAAGNGMSGCVRPDSDGVGADTGDPAPANSFTAVTSAPATGLRAWLSGTGAIRIPPLWITNGAAGAPDTLTIAFGDGNFGNWSDTALGATILTNTPFSCVITTPAGLTSVFRNNEFGVLLDTGATIGPRAAPLYNDRGCTLFQITTITSGINQLNHASGTTWNPGSNVVGLIPFDYVGGGTPAAGIRQFGSLIWVRFAIRAGTATTPPALTMQRLDQGIASTAQVLADGIEDMQIAYACDTVSDGDLPDGVPTKLTDEWTLNVTADPIPATCNLPDAIRITLIARSLTGDTFLSAVTNNKPAVEDGAAGAADQFRHRVLTTTVFPRNRN